MGSEELIKLKVGAAEGNWEKAIVASSANATNTMTKRTKRPIMMWLLVVVLYFEVVFSCGLLRC